MYYNKSVENFLKRCDRICSSPSASTLAPVSLGPAIKKIRDQHIKRLRAQDNWIGSLAMINWDITEREAKSKPQISLLTNRDAKAIHLAIRAGAEWWQAVELAYHDRIVALNDPADLVALEAKLETKFSKVADFENLFLLEEGRDDVSTTLYQDEHRPALSHRPIRRAMLEFYSPVGVLQAQQLPDGPAALISQLWDFAEPRQETT